MEGLQQFWGAFDNAALDSTPLDGAESIFSIRSC
jgi:hypothetical protein